MQLLEKREINQAKARDRQREIAEGLKLTRRVDDLRKLAVETEGSLETYRSATLGTIQEEIEFKIEERDALSIEIEHLTSKRNTLLVPLEAEWLKLEKQKEKFSLEKLELQKRDEDVIERERGNLAISVQLTLERKDFESEKTTLNQERLDIEKLKKNSKSLLKEASEKSLQIVAEAEIRDKESKQRDIDSYLREQNSLLKEVNLKQKEEAINTRETNVLALELIYNSPVKKR